MTTDSPVATAFVPAPDHWSRAGASPRAIVIHMAEGGGTVSWLTRDDGNSSHYVVEYSGRVVQMVREAEAAGSMNPRATRDGNDAPYTFLAETIVYGRTALNRAGISTDPNRFSIAIEIEGFAKDGPNAAQRNALRRLVADIRQRHGALDVLGHRDQQDYKACPGHRIPWADYGGHGAPGPVEEPMSIYVQRPQAGSFTIPKGRTIKALKPTASGFATEREYSPSADYSGRYDARLSRLAGDQFPTSLIRVVGGGLDGLYISTAEVTETDDAVPTAETIASARADGRAAMKSEAVAAVSALTP